MPIRTAPNAELAVAGVCTNSVKNTELVVLNDPVNSSEPDIVMSYPTAPVNASTDWDTCGASIVWPVVIPLTERTLFATAMV